MRQIPKLVALLCALVVCAAVADGQQYWGSSGGRSYYGYQNSHCYYGPYWGKGRTYYTYYYYRPSPDANHYNYHTVFYYPRNVGNIRGGYYYYKNQVTGKYWGRCKPESNDYELLHEDKRRPNLNDIPEADFARQGKMTPVPEMAPQTPLIPPPMPTRPPEE